MESYLRGWGSDLRDLVNIELYDDLPRPGGVSGSVIFADVERAGEDRIRTASSFLDSLPSGVRTLNHPARTARRRELLRDLYDAGVNSYRAYGLDEPLDGVRFPVFVRHSKEHTGSLTGLLRNQRELRDELMRLRTAMDPSLTLVVEHVDVEIGGIYREHSAFRIGDELIAHHVMFRTNWVVKAPSMTSPEMVREERSFQLSNPHSKLLDRVFRTASVDYGSVSYGVKDGRVEVWGVSTNPTILLPARAYSEAQMPAKAWFSSRVKSAMRSLA